MMKMPNSIEVQGGPITLVFSSNGRAFFSERITGNIWEVLGEDNHNLVKHLNVVHATGHHEVGVLGIALDPNFEKNGYVYAFYTEGKEIQTSENKVVRISIETGKEQVLLSGIPAGRIHNGGIIAFGPDGKLYIGVGVDNPIKEKAQDKKYLGGKILRINSDGSIPSDNPFKGSPVYSIGHRNIFGLAFHPITGKLYACDVGPDNDDEINIIEPGGNYGWPIVVGYSNDKRFIEPIAIYTPTITPTQSMFYKGELYFGSYNEGSVHKLTLSEEGDKVISDVVAYNGKPFGVVGVFASPEGEFFVVTTSSIKKIKLNGGGQKMNKSLITWIVVALVVLVLGIGGYYVLNSGYGNSGGNNNTNTPSTQPATPGAVNIQNFSFNPGTITVKKGDTITWTNNDSVKHHIVADDGSFDLGEVSGDGTSTHTFDTAGTFNYHCAIHPSMTGIIIVK